MVNLEGYKTYIVAVLMLIAGVLYTTKLIELDVLIGVMTILNGAGFAATRSAIEKK
jgi:hypothetical protein